ncbi:MAG TPA: hypothetical protein ENJ80_05525 [Gammaproteobacteria bacterium]|nr:hypothetical protein [Gammaproteobacteria bacterium]
MENYIVRIYRRDENDPEKVTGMLESVEYETRESFHSINALQALLTEHSGPGRRQRVRTDRQETTHTASVALLK